MDAPSLIGKGKAMSGKGAGGISGILQMLVLSILVSENGQSSEKIRERIVQTAGQDITAQAIHTVLNRLQRGNFVEKFSEKFRREDERRRAFRFSITEGGLDEIERLKKIFQELWRE